MEPAGLLPMSPTQLPPITFKTSLPPLPKSLPPLKEKSKVKKMELPPISPISDAPPTSKLPPLPTSSLPLPSKLPPLKSPPLETGTTTLPETSLPETTLPPIIPQGDERIKTGAEAVVVASPLAVEARKTRKEQFKKIEKEVEEKESTILGVGDDIKSLMGPLRPLSSAPIFEKETVKSKMPVSMPKVPETSLPPLPSLSSISSTQKTSLEIAQEGVETAKLAEPEASFQKEAKAAFQKKKKKPAAVRISELRKPEKLPDLPPLTGLKTLAFPTGEEETLTVIASPANLPSKPSPEGTPKIRIPKIKASPVRPSPSGRVKKTGGKISFPTTSTIIQPIPISSPSAVSVSKVKVATVSEEDIMENIKVIDLNKLSAERSAKGKTYSVAELKTIAGSLDLTKSGSKKDLVERIKAAILKVNPNAQFN